MPKVVPSEIGGEVDTQPIAWLPTASLSPEDWSESLFLKGKTNWYRCLSLRVKTQAPQLLGLVLSLRTRHRHVNILCAGATTQAHRSYTYQLWDASAGEWEGWHYLKRVANLGGAGVLTEVQTLVGEWIAKRSAEVLPGRGYKADSLVVEGESRGPAEAAPKGKMVVKAKGKPANPPTKPTPKAKPAKPTPPGNAPLAYPPPIPFPWEEMVRGIFDGVVRTWEGNVQTTLRDFFLLQCVRLSRQSPQPGLPVRYRSFGGSSL